MKDCRGRLKTPLNYKENCEVTLRQRTENDITRTNNKLEGFHRAIQGMYSMTLLIQLYGAFFKDFKKRRLFREAIGAFLSGQSDRIVIPFGP